MSHELRFERLFDAAPEEVFDALTDPEDLEEMYGRDEPGWIVESEGEVRVGDTWSVRFGPSREKLYRFVHTYEVVRRPAAAHRLHLGAADVPGRIDTRGGRRDHARKAGRQDLADAGRKRLPERRGAGFPHCRHAPRLRPPGAIHSNTRRKNLS